MCDNKYITEFDVWLGMGSGGALNLPNSAPAAATRRALPNLTRIGALP